MASNIQTSQNVMNKFQPFGPKAKSTQANFRGNSGGPSELREVINDKNILASAKSVFGKLGISYNFNYGDSGDWSERGMLNRRVELRNILDTVRNSYDKKKIGSITDEILDTMDFINAEIIFISNTLDMNAAESREFSSATGKPCAVRDAEGNRIGTFLSNSTLRSEALIAQQLSAHSQDGNFFGSDGGVSISDFFRGVANMKTSETIRNALSVGTDTSGGYTVPALILPGVLSALVPASSMLNAGANIAVLQDGAKSYRIAGIDTLPTAAWRNENGVVAESDPTFRAIDIVPRSLSFMFKISRELLADSQDLHMSLTVAIAAAFAKELDRAGLRGSGTAPEIKGLLNTPNVNSIAFGGVNGGTPTNYSSFVSAWKSIVSANAPEPTAAIMHPRDIATFANLADTLGQPLERPQLLDSMNFLQTSQIPTNLTTGTSNDTSEIYVGDFSQVTFYMREGVSIQLAPELYAANGQVGFFCHTRVDVAALHSQAFAVIKGIRP